MHWQVVVQAFINFFEDADAFRKFFIFWKYVYFFYENVKHKFDDEENDKNEHNPENDSHVADDREVLVPDSWKWRPFKFFSINARFQAQKIVSQDLE